MACDKTCKPRQNVQELNEGITCTKNLPHAYGYPSTLMLWATLKNQESASLFLFTGHIKKVRMFQQTRPESLQTMSPEVVITESRVVAGLPNSFSLYWPTLKDGSDMQQRKKKPPAQCSTVLNKKEHLAGGLKVPRVLTSRRQKTDAVASRCLLWQFTCRGQDDKF